MSEFRNKTSGEVLSQGQVRAANSNMSLPKVWNSSTLEALNVDPVLPAPQPSAGVYQRVERQGVEQDSSGNWIEKFAVVEMFSDTNVDGVTTTKAEHEAAYQATLDAAKATQHRATRDTRLAETDFYALTDVTLTANMTVYRQALRDITSHSDWPNLSDDDWPTKP